ncbi:hypothetical protein U9M48_037991 [Paspalum notatum var. saurae]|uniref:Uncharacterized protein n=1 Tax=Paspalum notatum var. saurae TaxID=547442 RepID=A0AAQ3UG29_PASNO
MLSRLPRLRAQIRSAYLAPVAAIEVLVEDICRCQDLHREILKVPQPELAVLERVGADVVRASQVQQEERRPERHQLVLLRHAAQGEVPKSVRCGGVGQLVRLPEEDPEESGGLATTDSREEEEDQLQGKASKDKDLCCPVVPSA